MAKHSHLRDESGVALVEFALVLPVLLLLVLGILDFGRAYNYWIDETALANVAARYAAVNQNPGASTSMSLQRHLELKADTEELRTGSDQVEQAIDICLSFPEGTNVGDPVVVQATATYRWFNFLTGDTAFGDMAPTTVIRGSATMRLEARPTNVFAGCA